MSLSYIYIRSCPFFVVSRSPPSICRFIPSCLRRFVPTLINMTTRIRAPRLVHPGFLNEYWDVLVRVTASPRWIHSINLWDGLLDWGPHHIFPSNKWDEIIALHSLGDFGEIPTTTFCPSLGQWVNLFQQSADSGGWTEMALLFSPFDPFNLERSLNQVKYSRLLDFPVFESLFYPPFCSVPWHLYSIHQLPVIINFTVSFLLYLNWKRAVVYEEFDVISSFTWALRVRMCQNRILIMIPGGGFVGKVAPLILLEYADHIFPICCRI